MVLRCGLGLAGSRREISWNTDSSFSLKDSLSSGAKRSTRWSQVEFDALYKMVGHSTRKHEVDGEKKRKTVEFSPKMRFFSMFRGRIRSRVEPSAQSHGAREKSMRSTRWCAIYSEKKRDQGKNDEKMSNFP